MAYVHAMRVDEVELPFTPSVLDGYGGYEGIFCSGIKLRRDQRIVANDDSEIMDIFHDPVELEHDIAQIICDMRWAPLTRHAVLNEELTDSDLITESGQPIGMAVSERAVPEGWIIFEQR